MLNVVLVAGAIFCALCAIIAKRLLSASLWLAACSALTAILLYQIGAQEVAVIELSVGAGLVTVLFVFAIGVAGEETVDVRSVIPRPLAAGLVILSVLLLGWMSLPLHGEVLPPGESAFAKVVWQQRGLDMLLQIVLVFAGVIGVLGLMAEAPTPKQTMTQLAQRRQIEDAVTLVEMQR